MVFLLYEHADEQLSDFFASHSKNNQDIYMVFH